MSEIYGHKLSPNDILIEKSLTGDNLTFEQYISKHNDTRALNKGIIDTKNK